MITPEAIEKYCIEHQTPMHDVFSELAEATKLFAPHAAHMQVGKLEGKFLSIITQLLGVNTVLEFGTFTGFSALCFAEALPAHGKITTLDLDPKATGLAKDFWKKSELDHKIELILGNAKDSTHKLSDEIGNKKRPLYDLAFIDADKGGYDFYFEACLTLVRPGGAILIDNVLWSGAVLNPKAPSDHTIHSFNEKLKSDPRVNAVMLPVRDGLTLAYIK